MELNTKDFFISYVCFVAAIAVLVLIIMVVGKTSKKIKGGRKKKKNRSKRDSSNVKAIKAYDQNEHHSEMYLQYYNNIGTMSFQELDQMRSVLGEYYDDLTELEGLTVLINKNKGRTMNDDDRAKITEYRNQEIKGRPYGCRTYGEACDLVAKAYKNKEYWNYINR